MNNIRYQSNQGLSLLFAFLLCFIGGYADVATFLTFGVFSGHLTGNSVTSLVYIVEGKHIALLYAIIALSGFMMGTLAGIFWRRGLTNKARMHWALIIEIILIGGVALLLKALGDSALIKYLFIAGLSFSLGLQNGMYAKVLSATLHSSYITGTTISWLEAAFYVDKSDEGKLFNRKVMLVTLVAFISGAFLGALITHFFGIDSFILLIFLMCIATILCKGYWQHIFP